MRAVLRVAADFRDWVSVVFEWQNRTLPFTAVTTRTGLKFC